MEFEKVEQGLFRKILLAHSKTPIECIYLELGVIPFRFYLMTRRILYYQTIMNRDSREITKRIVQLQKEEHNEGTFYQQVESDMVDLNISEDDLLNSHTVLKKQLQDATAKLAFQHLIDMVLYTYA